MPDYSAHDYDAEDRLIGCLGAFLVGLVVLMTIVAIVRAVA